MVTILANPSPEKVVLLSEAGDFPFLVFDKVSLLFKSVAQVIIFTLQ
jgi:hypothetical protein